MENTYNHISGVLSLFFESSLSLFKLLLRPWRHDTLPLPVKSECSVLGNGPSLTQSFERHLEFIKSTEIFCVNNFAHSTFFQLLHPQNYCLLDPYYFLYDGKRYDREDVKLTIEAIASVQWKMNLFVPRHSKYSEYFRNYVFKNSNISVYFFNYTVVRGFSWFRHILFRYNLGMPQCQNVLAACLFLAINRKFKSIYLFGADHSWHENLRVTNDNSLQFRDVHFYDIDQARDYKRIYIAKQNQHPSISKQFEALSKTFYAYEILKQYADWRKLKINNSSERSYIDVFERKRPS